MFDIFDIFINLIIIIVVVTKVMILESIIAMSMCNVIMIHGIIIIATKCIIQLTMGMVDIYGADENIIMSTMIVVFWLSITI